MTFSTEWEDLYKNGTHLSIWPWSDLVSFVSRYAKKSNGYKRVLELGCGAGANIPFFLKTGVEYQSIEGSAAIVGALHKAFPELKDRIIAGDFTKDLGFSGQFDLIVDRASLPHNQTNAILHTLQMAFSRLREGGKFIGIEWFSEHHGDAKRGEFVETYTRKNLPPDSHLAGTGVVHFFGRDELIGLLKTAGFKLERLEHKEVKPLFPEELGKLGWWNFIAARP